MSIRRVPGPRHLAVTLVAILLVVLVGACAPAEEPATEGDGTEEAAEVAAPPSAEEVLEDPRRPDSERERDAGTRPMELYDFFGFEEEMTIADLIPGGGYNTFLLSRIVGPEGTVIAVPTSSNLERRIAQDELDNVVQMTGWDELQPESLDAALTVRNIHDLEERGGAEQVYRTWFEALKPGGILGVVDANTTKEGLDSDTHRINKQTVIDHLTAVGFELVDESEMLARPDDDYEDSGFSSDRWKVDRFALRFQKPEAMAEEEGEMADESGESEG